MTEPTPSAPAGPAANLPSGAPAQLLGASDIRRLAEEIGVRPTKTLGQNFVIDGNTIRRIVAAADISADETVLEVGPGLGSLTLGLLDAAKSVVAVEIDPVLAGKLPATVARWRPDAVADFHLVLADAMKVTELPVQPTALVANLPYNVAVPVVLHLLQHFPSLRHGLVMVQDEVADRLAAPPGSKTYGVPSVKAAWYSGMRKAGVIGMERLLAGAQDPLRTRRLHPPGTAGHHGHPGTGLRRDRRGLRAAAQDPPGRAGRLGRQRCRSRTLPPGRRGRPHRAGRSP